MKSLLMIGGAGAAATWFLWKSHKTLAYIAAAATAVVLWRSWKG